MSLSCRFYANEFPDVKDTVVVKVKEITGIGVYVTLPEYNNKEGLMPLSELSRRRIRSAKQLIGVGWRVCVVVTRVDNDTLMPACTLSKRRADPKDLLQCEDRFSRARAINIILRHVAEQLSYDANEQLEELYEKTAWHFDRKAKKRAAAYDTFNKALTDPTVFDECDIGNDVKAKRLEGIQTTLTHQEWKVQAIVEVSCFDYEGVEAVKTALAEGKKCSTEEMLIKIHVYTSPVFIVTTHAVYRVEGIDAMNKVLDEVKNSIESSGGTFKIVKAAACIWKGL